MTVLSLCVFKDFMTLSVPIYLKLLQVKGVIGVPIETCVTVVLPQQVAVRDSQRRACFVAEKQNDVQTGHD